MLYRWLPRVFGCHCRSDRSFHYNGHQFPLCARCTGELIGIIFSMILFWFWKPSIIISFFMLIPLILDGVIQRLSSYESTNFKRLITGSLFGIGLMSLLTHSTITAFKFGISFGQILRAKQYKYKLKALNCTRSWVLFYSLLKIANPVMQNAARQIC